MDENGGSSSEMFKAIANILDLCRGVRSRDWDAVEARRSGVEVEVNPSAAERGVAEGEVVRSWFARDEDMSVNSLEIDRGEGAGEDDTDKEPRQAARADAEAAPATERARDVVRDDDNSHAEGVGKARTTTVSEVVGGYRVPDSGSYLCCGRTNGCGHREKGIHNSSGGRYGRAGGWRYCPPMDTCEGGVCPISGWTSCNRGRVSVCNSVGMARNIWRTREGAPQRSDLYIEEGAWHWNGWEDSFLSFFSFYRNICHRTESS